MLRQEYGRPALQHGFDGNPFMKGSPLGKFIDSNPREARKAGDAFGLDLREFISTFGSEAPIRLNTRDLLIPEPGPGFRSNPGYNPASLPLLIHKEILNPGFMGADGFGVS